MVSSSRARRSGLFAALLCAPALFSGCATWTCPTIVPVAQTTVVPPAAEFTPLPGPFLCDHDCSLSLVPRTVVAPVGSEVVLIAGVCGPDGYLETGERVEWSLTSGSVGHFVTVADRECFDWLDWFEDWPRKVNNSFAIGSTSRRYVRLTRGTPAVTDDVTVSRGQTWISLTSPVEGASYVTAFAPDVYGWDLRQQSSTVHWVDAQWSFPPPAVNPIGTSHTFTTTVTRAGDSSPLAGWIVRYEIAGGPPATFGPGGGTVAEVATNELGQANVEIVQQTPARGTNDITIQVVRPGSLPGGGGARFVVGAGRTSKTWTSPDISLRHSGPSQATIGATLTYRIDVANPGEVATRQVVVSQPIPAGLSFVSSTPPAETVGGQLQWRLGDLSRGQSARIEAIFRADRAGAINNCVSAATAEGLTAQQCVTTSIVETAVVVPEPQPQAPPALDVVIRGPETAEVGEELVYEVEVTNRGNRPATGLVIVDRYDPGLQHGSAPSPIESDLGDLSPGQSRIVSITLSARQSGELCHTVEVTGSAGERGSARSCVRVGGATPATNASLSVRKAGPARRTVGETAEFTIEITNDGDATLHEVSVADRYDLSLSPTLASEGYQFVGDDLVWKLGTLDPGKSASLQVHCNCVEAAARACNRVAVTCREGVTEESTACLEILPGQSRLTVTTSALREPVEVGNQASYVIRVTNQAADSDRRVEVVVTFPPELTPIPTATGPSKPSFAGQTVRFEPVLEIRGNETLTYQVQARAARAGDVVVQVDVTSEAVTQPVRIEQRSTLFSER